MSSLYLAGMDFSMSCPCLAIIDPKDQSFESTNFYYITKINKHAGTFNNHIHGTLEFKYSNQQQRFDQISDHFIEILLKYNVKDFAIEGYSYGSTGSVFDISENTGVLKHKLYKNNINIHIFAPTEIKKFATKKGNANKEAMFVAFVNNYVDFRPSINYTKPKIDNPVSDIVDSFYISKLLCEKFRNN